MRLRLRYEHWIPRALGVQGIVLYPYVLFSGKESGTSLTTLQHELIHVRQVRANGFFPFYLRYAGEYLKARARGASHEAAYREISFEAEAYRDQARLALTAAERAEIGRG